MSKITNDGLTRSGTGCFNMYPYSNSERQRLVACGKRNCVTKWLSISVYVDSLLCVTGTCQFFSCCFYFSPLRHGINGKVNLSVHLLFLHASIALIPGSPRNVAQNSVHYLLSVCPHSNDFT